MCCQRRQQHYVCVSPDLPIGGQGESSYVHQSLLGGRMRKDCVTVEVMVQQIFLWCLGKCGCRRWSLPFSALKRVLDHRRRVHLPHGTFGGCCISNKQDCSAMFILQPVLVSHLPFLTVAHHTNNWNTAEIVYSNGLESRHCAVEITCANGTPQTLRLTTAMPVRPRLPQSPRALHWRRLAESHSRYPCPMYRLCLTYDYHCRSG